MAARRLIVVLVLLLSASVVAAALAPDRTGPGAEEEPTSSSTTSTTSTTTTPGEPAGSDGESVAVEIVARAKEPETVEGFVGDQLALDVGSAIGRTIELEPLGLAEFAGPDAPARFDLLLRDPGTIPITDADGGEILGRLMVSEPGEPDQGEVAKQEGRAEDPPQGPPRDSESEASG